MLAGAKSYQKYYTWWSPALHNTILTKKYWMLKRIELQHNINMSIPLQEILNILPSTDPLHEHKSSMEINKYLQSGRQQLRTIRMNDRNIRNAFLDAQQI